MKIAIVLGCGYGDEGKGLVTDYLVRKFHSPETTTVVRFSGGQQAGHTVVTEDGKSHIFSNYGAGSLAGASSYFSEHCTFYPPNILNERTHLIELGGNLNLTIHPLAHLTTPMDVAYNRFLETIRQSTKSHHGSCGLGIGATIERNTLSPYKLFAVDLLYPELLHQKMKGFQAYYHNKIIENKDASIQTKAELFLEMLKPLLTTFYNACEKIMERNIVRIADYSVLHSKYSSQNLIFEGSQGLLLDMDHGLFPYVTRTSTTCKNVYDILDKISFDYHRYGNGVDTYYVSRCYQTRHGVGWMENEWKKDYILEDKTNVFNQWQENIRFADFDYDALNYAIAVNEGYNKCSSGLTTLVLTHMDQRPSWKLDKSLVRANINILLSSWGPTAKDIHQYDQKPQLV